MSNTIPFPPRRYLFRRDKLRLPETLHHALPPHIRKSIRATTEAAGLAFQFLRQLDSHFAQRFYRLCPVEDAERFTNHCISIRVLLGGAENDLYTHVPLNTKEKKTPAAALDLHVDEYAYKQYIREHENLKWLYLRHPFALWRHRAAHCDYLLRTANIAPEDKRMCLDWFYGFIREMEGWDKKCSQLVLPTWEEMVNFVEETVGIVADASNPWM
jgi:hypothetical protein